MNKQVESRYPLWTGLTSFENCIEHQVTSQNINLRRKKTFKKFFEIGLATVVFFKKKVLEFALISQSRLGAYVQSYNTLALKL